MAEENIDTSLAPDDFALAFAAASAGDGDIEDEVITTAEGEGDGGASEEIAEVTTASDEIEGTDDGAGEDTGEEVKVEAKPEPKEEVKVEAKEESKPDPAILQAAKDKEDAEARDASDRELPTAEESEILATVLETYPEVVKALAAQERVLTAKLENKFNKQIQDIRSQFEQRIVPTENVTQQIARSRHEAEILAAHSDAFAVLPKVETWIGTQPTFLQKTYNAILDKGSSADIVALYDIFKKETGSAHSQSPEEVVQQKADAEKAKAEKAVKDKKLKSMEHVKGRQTAQKSGIDENDFESAFNIAANS